MAAAGLHARERVAVSAAHWLAVGLLVLMEVGVVWGVWRFAEAMDAERAE